MRREIIRGTLGIGFLVGLCGSPFLTGSAAAQEAQIAESAVTLSSGGGRAELWIALSDGSEHRLTFADGRVRVDGVEIGTYAPNAGLASTWRELLREQAGTDGASVRDALLSFREVLADAPASASSVDGTTARALAETLAGLLGVETESTAPEGQTAGISVPATSSLEIVPGGMGLDVTRELDRLRDALGRLGDVTGDFDDRLAMIVHDDYEIPRDREIPGHVALLDGTLRLKGKVNGDVLILDGTLELHEDAVIHGDVIQVGGELDVEGTTAAIEGEILSDLSLTPAAPVVAEANEAPVTAERRVESTGRSPRRRGPFNRLAHNLAQATEGLLSAISTFIGLALLGGILVYSARGRLETVSDTVRHEFARSFAMGLAGQVLFFPALLILLVLVITWPLVPFFVLGCALAGLVGYVAVAHGAGEMFAERRYRYEWLERLRRSNSYYYVVSGLVLLLLPFVLGAVLWVLGGAVDVVRGLVAFVACVGTWILATAGFGSVLLTRAGGRSVVVDWRAGADAGLDETSFEADAPPTSAEVDVDVGDAEFECEDEADGDDGDDEGKA